MNLDIGKKLAILVGINKYDDQNFITLHFCDRDIEKFSELMVSKKGGACEAQNIIALTDNTKEKPIRNNIISKLKAIAKQANGEETIVFYFSGHGYETKGKSYLLCSDSKRNALEDTALPMELVRKTMEESLARVKIIIVDACRSEVIKGIKDSGVMSEAFFQSFFPPSEGFVVITACNKGESSHEWDEKEHGVFSYYFLEGLNGNADTNGDKIISITDAYLYARQHVTRWAFNAGAEQNPFLEAKVTGDIPLVVLEAPAETKQTIDKSVIEEITISTRFSDTTDTAISESMCGVLLQFVSPTKIKKEGEDYEFPYGSISTRYHVSDDAVWTYAGDVTFNYIKENWDTIDKIAKYFDVFPNYFWNSISYQLKRNIDVDKLAEKCRKSDFKIMSYKALENSERIIAETKAWLGTVTTFQNLADGSEIIIQKSGNGNLANDFYLSLSPENIMEFIKDCLQ